MKIYIDFSKQAITKIDSDVAYVGDVYSNVFVLLFYNYGVATDWFPTMSQLAPNGREAGDFSADALEENETYDYVENDITYKRYTFTIGDGWVKMKGRSNFFIWVNKLVDTNALQRKCYGKLNVVLNESTDNYFIQDAYLNPKVKEYIDNTIGDDLETYKATIDDEVESQNETIASLSQASPSVFDTASNITALTENKGVAVATDTGYIYYWDSTLTTPAYVNSNILYQSTGIADGSIGYFKITDGSIDLSKINKPIADNFIKTGTNLFNKFLIETGKRITNVGTTNVTTDSASCYIGVDASKSTLYLSYNRATATSMYTRAVFFDENKSIISNSYVEGFLGTISIPSGAYYIRVSIPTAKVDYYQIEYDGITAYNEFAYSLNYSIPNKSVTPLKLSDDLINLLDAKKNLFNKNDLEKGTITNVGIASHSSRYVSNFIKTYPGLKLYISYNGTGFSTVEYTRCIFYDKQKDLIQGSYVEGWLNYVVAPSNAYYVRFAVPESKIDKYQIERGQMSSYEEFELSITKQYTCVNCFSKIAALGDSYTAASTKHSGSEYWTDQIEQSYIATMAKRNGIDYANYGVGGSTTRSILTSQKWSNLLNDEACDLYIIAFGINDAALGLDYLGTIEDIKTDYTQNADTFYGNYGKIIKQIQNKSSKARIVLSRIVLTGETRDKFSEAISLIGNHFGLPVINPEEDDFFTSKLFSIKVDGHPTTPGYAGMGVAYERLLSKAINENPTYFLYSVVG